MCEKSETLSANLPSEFELTYRALVTEKVSFAFSKQLQAETFSRQNVTSDSPRIIKGPMAHLVMNKFDHICYIRISIWPSDGRITDADQRQFLTSVCGAE